MRITVPRTSAGQAASITATSIVMTSGQAIGGGLDEMDLEAATRGGCGLGAATVTMVMAPAGPDRAAGARNRFVCAYR